VDSPYTYTPSRRFVKRLLGPLLLVGLSPPQYEYNRRRAVPSRRPAWLRGRSARTRRGGWCLLGGHLPRFLEGRRRSQGLRLRLCHVRAKAEPSFQERALRAASVKAAGGRRHDAERVVLRGAACASWSAFAELGSVLLSRLVAQPGAQPDAPPASFVCSLTSSVSVPSHRLSGGAPVSSALGVGSVVMNQSAVRPCPPKRLRGAEGAARMCCGVGAFSTVVRLVSPKLVLSHKAVVFGEGREFHAPSLRSASARCAQLRSSQSGVAVTVHGESLMEPQPLVLHRPSQNRVSLFSRSPQPNLAFERTRRQRVSFGVVALSRPCLLMARHRRAAQRRRYAT